MKDAASVLVVGGGVVGLSCAYYLAQAGRQVTVLERDSSLLRGSSEGNAGMIVPSHFVPLAAPGVITQGLKWMLNPSSPFYLRPRLDFGLARWIWLFFRHANAGHVKRSEVLLRDLGLESRRLHIELAKSENYPLEERGLLMLCQSQKGLDEEAEMAQEAQRLGLSTRVFGRSELQDYEPEAKIDALGGVWFEQDCHLSPMDFVTGLRAGITRCGGQFVSGEAVDLLKEDEQVIGVKTDTGDSYRGDRVILAGGIATTKLARGLGAKVPMQGGKGYSLTLTDPRKALQLCSLLKEGRVAVTPMGKTLRVAGTMEICGSDTSLSPRRLEGIIESFCRFYPEFTKDDFEGIEPWIGLRPCSPDGLPYLGPIPGQERVVVATGHSMMGLSLAPATGWLIEKLIAGEASPLDLTPLNPARFG